MIASASNLTDVAILQADLAGVIRCDPVWDNFRIGDDLVSGETIVVSP